MNQNTPPEEFTGDLDLNKPETQAAGLAAITASFEHVLRGTGIARGWKALVNLNQKDGFDCPSCAWPDPDGDRSSIAEYCESGAKAVADEVMTKHTASPVLFQRYSVAELTAKSDLWLGQQGRLTQPLVLRPGHSGVPATHYVPIDWSEAFRLIADQLNALESPNEAIFYTSGRTSNEAAFVYQLFVKMFGTNNMPDCSNMCHESTTVALTETLGLGKASVTYEDYEAADVVMIMGQNPGTTAPRMLTPLEQMKRNGGKIIAVNPLHEAGLLGFKYPQSPRDMLLGGVKLADVFLQVRINSDLALLKAMCKLLLAEENKTPGKVLDQLFINQYTSGYEAFVKSLDHFDLNDLAAQCGLTVAQIQEAVDLFKYTPKLVIIWAMGLTQHKNGVATISELINLLLLKGSIGIKGGGASPIRGHSNVQGDRTMGVWEKTKPELLEALERVFQFTPPREPGYDAVASVKAMYEGKAHVFFGLGGNFAMAVSDTNYTGEALRRCKLTVHVSTKLNRSHLIHGETALILPCLGRTDHDVQATGRQFVSCESTTGVVAQSHGIVDAVSPHLKSEVAIICALAKATLNGKSTVDWDNLTADYDQIRDLIAQTIDGFDGYNKKVRKPGGFYIPNGPRKREFTKTSDGKAHFTVNVPTPHDLQPGELLLMTIRSHDQFNTTVYKNADRYRGVHNERRVVFMHPDDIANRGFQEKQAVDLHSRYDGVTRTAHRFLVVPYDIPRGCIAAYYPETNVLIPIDQMAEKSHTPISKSIIATVTPTR